MSKNKKIAIVNYRTNNKSTIDDVLTLESQRYSSFDDLQKKLGIKKGNRVRIDHYSLNGFLNSDIDQYDKIIIESFTGRTSQLERELIEQLSYENLSKIVNFSGETLIKEEALGKNLEDIDFSRYKQLAPKILSGNKALTEILLDGHESLINRHGFGFDTPDNISSNNSLPDENLILKPTQGSHVQGVKKVDGRTFRFTSIEDCIFGSNVAQEYIQQQSVNKLNRASDLRVVVSKDQGQYKYHAMIRIGEEDATCSNLSGGGFGVGIIPGRRINGDVQRKIARMYGIDPDNPSIPEKILQYSQEFADKFNYNILGLDFVAEKKSNKQTRYKLLEANSNPGARIFHYLGLTNKNKDLEDFVLKEGLDKKAKLSPIDKTPALDYAKAKLIKTIHVMRSLGTNTRYVEEKLGLSSENLMGFTYDNYSKINQTKKTDQEIQERINLKESSDNKYNLNDFFENSLLKKYLEANGISGKAINYRNNRRVILDKVINRNQIKSILRNVDKSIEQGIIDSYSELKSRYNKELSLEDNDLLTNQEGVSSKEQMYLLSDEILQQAIAARKQLRQSFLKFHRAKKSKGLDEKIRLYEEAVNLDPNFLRARSNLGLMYARNGEIEKSHETLLKVLSIDPNRKKTKQIYQQLFEEY